MPNTCRVLHFTAIVFLSTFTGIAQEIETPADAVESPQAAAASAAPEQQSALKREILDSLRQFFNFIVQPKPVSSGTTAPMIPATTAFQAESGCLVAPLDPIEETSAAQLEISGTNVVDVDDMVPAAAVADG